MDRIRLYKISLFILALAGLIIVFFNIYKKLQEVFIILCFIPSILYILKNKTPFLGYFYGLFGSLLSFSFIIIYTQIINMLFPKRNVFETEDGMEHLTMDMSWLWIIPLSIFTTFFILNKYRKKLHRKPKEEFIFSFVILFFSVAIYTIS